MEYRTKVIIISWVLIALSLILIVFCTGMLSHQNTVIPSSKDSYGRTIELSKTSNPTKIIVYGDDCKFRKEVSFTQISSITKEAFEGNNGYDYKIVVINDINNNAELNNEDFDILKAHVLEGEYDLYYFGSRYLARFAEAGFVSTPFSNNAGGFKLAHRKNSSDTKITEIVWTQEDKTAYEKDGGYLGQLIFTHIRHSYYENASN